MLVFCTVNCPSVYISLCGCYYVTMRQLYEKLANCPRLGDTPPSSWWQLRKPPPRNHVCRMSGDRKYMDDWIINGKFPSECRWIVLGVPVQKYSSTGNRKSHLGLVWQFFIEVKKWFWDIFFQKQTPTQKGKGKKTKNAHNTSLFFSDSSVPVVSGRKPWEHNSPCFV